MRRELKKIIVEPVSNNQTSNPRRYFFFKERPNVDTEIEIRLFGDRGIGIALQEYSEPSGNTSKLIPTSTKTTQCFVTHEPTATLYLEPISNKIIERRLLTLREKQDLGFIQELHTDAMWLLPTYSAKTDIPRADLSIGGARILIAIFRMLLPNLYRGGDSLELSLCLTSGGESLHKIIEPLHQNAIVFFDLQQGNGASRCIHREGVLLLIRC